MASRTVILLPPGLYDAWFVSNHDGDTFRAWLPVEVVVRMDGVQVAELSTEKGKEEAAWLRNRIVGKWGQLDLRGEYKYGGERMGVPFIDGVDIAKQMLAEGRAVAWDGKGPRPVGLMGGTDMPLSDEDIDRIAARLRASGPVVVGPDGNRVLPVSAPLAAEPRPPFDWSPWVKALTPILLSFVLAVLSYYGVNLSSKVDTAAGEASAAAANAKTAAVQSKENAARIDQTHTELRAHGKQLDKIADRPPGK